MRKNMLLSVTVIAVMTLNICGVSFAADEKKPMAPAPKSPLMATAKRPNLNMFGGTIENIDRSDPANIKISVKSETDGVVHTLSVAPFTNITKITDASELKTGDAVRVMARKTEDNKETAMGILFGKIKNLPPMRPRPVPPTAPQIPPKPVVKQGVKK